MVRFNQLLALAFSSLAAAVYKDEVGDIDFHYSLFGVPQAETTFFHRPRKADKASLLYTLGDVGVVGAVNPSNGEVVWRHQISDNITTGGGHLRAPEDQDWVASAHGSAVQSWNALTGRNIWHAEFDGEIKDLEVMEVTESERKDVLALHHEEGVTVLRRLHGATGAVVWEFREHNNKDIPLQVSTNIANIYVISLHGSPSSYSLKVTSLDVVTGSRVNDWTIGTKGEVHGPEDVMFVGGNSAAPLVAWTDKTLSKLNVHVLGSKGKQDIPLGTDVVSVDIHAPRTTQSQAHFLVHTTSETGNRAEVYHTHLKNGQISKAYELPHLKGVSAFSTSSEGANVYFTRVTDYEVIIVSSESPAILSRWLLEKGDGQKVLVDPIHAVSEVIKKPGSEGFAIRSAVATADEDWVLVRNGEIDWVRPEGLSGAVAAVWADIPYTENLLKVLEQEADTNPVSAYVHRVSRHISDLQYLPAYLATIPTRLAESILGTGLVSKDTSLHRDSFGFNKIIVLATRRGRFYGLNTGNNGAVVWTTKVFPQAKGQAFEVKGIVANEAEGSVTVRGSKGESASINAATGETVSVVSGLSITTVDSTALVDGPLGPWLLTFGADGKPIELIPADLAPKETVVTRSGTSVIKGIKFVESEGKVSQVDVWQLQVLPGQRIVEVGVRAAHDPVASIGRVLGDRRVNYKYLNVNTVVIAVFNDENSSLSIQLIDTISGQLLASQLYDGVDPTKAVSCAISENWYACSFYGQYALNDGTGRLIKGYQLVSSDLYESPDPNDRGPLGSAENFSSVAPVDSPSGGPPFPWVVSQGFVIAQPVTNLAVTQTRQGIASRQLLAYLPENHAIAGIPRIAIDPRRPVGREPTAPEMEAEGLFKYFAGLEIDPRNIISHERDVIGIKELLPTPAVVESTSLLVAYGVDVFGTRVAPSGVFDILGNGFNKLTLILTVVALFGGVVFLSPMVRRKQINRRWES